VVTAIFPGMALAAGASVARLVPFSEGDLCEEPERERLLLLGLPVSSRHLASCEARL